MFIQTKSVAKDVGVGMRKIMRLEKPGLYVTIQVAGGGSISNVLGLHAKLKDLPLSFAASARSEISFFPPNTLTPNVVYERWCHTSTFFDTLTPNVVYEQWCHTSTFFDNTAGHWPAVEMVSVP